MTPYGRRYRRGRYGRRRGDAGALPVLAITGALLAAGAGAKAAASPHQAAQPARHAPPARGAAVAGAGENAYFTAVTADLGAPATKANLASMAAWAAREGCWGCVGANNPLDTTLPGPGSWNFNNLGGGAGVQNYPTASEGAQATASTLLGGYPSVVSALRSGSGVCGPGFAAEFFRWSGGGYQEVC